MVKSSYKHGQDSQRGGNHSNSDRSLEAGRGRGRDRGRGRRGYGPGSRGRGQGVKMYHSMQEIEELSMQSEFRTFGRGSSLLARGFAQKYSGIRSSGSITPVRGSDSPRGRGRGDITPRRGRGRGRGREPNFRGRDAPLSKLLNEERPFLKPIVFVRSEHTPLLFRVEEEILQPVVEDVGEKEQDHLPTASQVFRVFSSGHQPPMFSNSDEDQGGEDLEVIDFNDAEKLLDFKPTPASKSDIEVVEEQFTGFYINSRPTMDHSYALDGAMAIPVDTATSLTTSDDHAISADSPVPHAQPMEAQPSELQSSETPAFYIDTEPSPVAPENQPTLSARREAIIDDDEDVIVYVAPHPRSGRDTRAPEPQTAAPLLETSVLTGTMEPGTSTSTANHTEQQGDADVAQPPSPSPANAPQTQPASGIPSSGSGSPAPQKHQRRYATFTPKSKAIAFVKSRTTTKRVQRKRKARQAMFSSFGALMSEARLHNASADEKDPMYESRRRDDSDIDWGSDDDGGAAGAAGNAGNRKVQADDGLAEGMELDPDIQFDMGAMKSFMEGMSSKGQRFVTMDDIADEEKLKQEDEEELVGRDAGSSGDSEPSEEDAGSESSEGEIDAILDAEERLLIAEDDVEVGEPENDEDDEDEDESSSDDDLDDFSSRLQRLREASRAQKSKATTSGLRDDDIDDYEELSFNSNLSWAEQDEAYIATLEDILGESDTAASGRSRKGRKKLYEAIRNGSLDDLEAFQPAVKRKEKGKFLPPELAEQWEKDRKKKAERKRARELEKLETAADPLSKKKGGTKGKKAMLAAAKMDATIQVLPNRVIDMTTLVQQIRRFLTDIGGPGTMSLPPCDKETRRSIHEMAIAFGLKSQSKGKGDARYTMLIKKSISGVRIDERKISKILRRTMGGGDFTGSDSGRGGRGKGKARAPAHKEGDEVGKMAPKIDASNIGFRMLAAMGWSEGERIGISGGLDAPLTAIIKRSKLGLGATR